MNTRSIRGLAILAGGLAFVGTASAIDLIVNGSFEDVTDVGVDTTPAGWSGVCRGYNFSAVYWAGPAIPPAENPGSIYTWRHRGDVSDGAFATPMTQLVDLTAGASTANIDANRGQYTFSAWMASYTFNDDQPYVTVQFLDANTNQVGGTVIFDRVNSLFFTTFADGVTAFDSDEHLHSWAKYVKTGAIPPLARKASVGIQHSPNSSFSGGPDTYVDLVKLDVSVADTRPSIESASPGGSGTPANASVSVTLRDGFFSVNTNTLVFRFDGAPAAAAISKVGPLTSIQYAPGLLPSGTPHNYQVVYSDSGPGLPQTNAFSFAVATYPTLPASYAYPAGSGTTRGFTIRTVAAPLGTPQLANTLARARDQLDGTLIDPLTELPYENAATLGSNQDGSYNIDTVLDFDNDGAVSGNFPNDQQFPGLSGFDNSFSSEALLYLELPAGYYRFGVNSDDGFELSAGKPPQGVFGPRTVVGFFDNGRGAANSLFDFLVQTNGIYAFNLIFFEGGGSASCELFSVNLATGQKILVNDTNAAAIKSYRVLTGVSLPPYVRYVQPAPNATDVPVDAIIRAGIWDRATAVVPPIQLMLNGTLVSPVTGKTGIVTTVSYQPPTPLAFGSTNTVRLVHGDGAISLTNTWSFVTIPLLRITSVARNGTDVVIDWVGGTPPYQVQFKDSFTNLVWTDSGAPTTTRSATVPIQPGAGFIRVMGQ